MSYWDVPGATLLYYTCAETCCVKGTLSTPSLETEIVGSSRYPFQDSWEASRVMEEEWLEFLVTRGVSLPPLAQRPLTTL
jgi:hypothetical protein